MNAHTKKYCICWISFFNNELCMDFCYATGIQHALAQAYERLAGEEWTAEDCNSDIKQAAFDMDGMIDAIEVE